MIVGEIRKNNFGNQMEIINFKNSKNIDILFLDDGYICHNKEYKDFLKGKIKSPYEKRTFGVGYLGEGKYKTRENDKKTKIYVTWKGILERCYNNNKQQVRPTYKDCSVCEEWHNFQNFAKWFEENYYEIAGERMALDKDILVKGNKIYSPETCVFVPRNINSLFTKSDAIRGNFPIGVSEMYPWGYASYCNNGFKKHIHLGIFNTPEQAFNTYKQYKEKLIKEIADIYKDKIPQKLYDAMYKYEVEITD